MKSFGLERRIDRAVAVFEPSRWLQDASPQDIETAVMLALLPQDGDNRVLAP